MATMGQLKECKLCRKLFSGAGRVCQDCMKYLDEIYQPVRTYIRDHKNPRSLSVDDIATATEIPMKFIQALIDEGYLAKEVSHIKPNMENYNNDDKEKLSKQLEKAIVDLKTTKDAQKSITYGQERYSNKNKK